MAATVDAGPKKCDPAVTIPMVRVDSATGDRAAEPRR